MSSNDRYFLFFGGVPDLSWAEVSALLPAADLTRRDGYAEYRGELDPHEFGRKVGGIRKIARSLQSVAQKDVTEALIAQISAGERKNVALTDYADLQITESDLVAIKKAVARPLRFVSLATDEHELVMLARQHVAEYCLLPEISEPGSSLEIDEPGSAITIAETVWIFDAEDWIRRDRAKPYRDIKRGMLPPKLARMLVNMATRGVSDLTLLDPFCGTGTVLSEALLAGASHVYGSDTNAEAVKGAQQNLAWLTTLYQLPSDGYQCEVVDVARVDTFVPQVDCIVTEPYMGPLIEERHVPPLAKLQDIARGLDKLYRGAFRTFAKILPPGGRVVMTIPSFAAYGRILETIHIDTLESLGYNYISSVAYSKPGAIVIRNITILEKS